MTDGKTDKDPVSKATSSISAVSPEAAPSVITEPTAEAANQQQLETTTSSGASVVPSTAEEKKQEEISKTCSAKSLPRLYM